MQLPEGLTFDEVLLVPAHSEVLPKETDLTTYITPRIKLNIPLLSAAMDTVTEARAAICMAREGGLGIVHKNLTPAEQAIEVDQVKKSESGMIVDPITMHPDQKIYEALELMKKYRISPRAPPWRRPSSTCTSTASKSCWLSMTTSPSRG